MSYPASRSRRVELVSSSRGRVRSPPKGSAHAEQCSRSESVRDGQATDRHRGGPDRYLVRRPRGPEAPEARVDGQLPGPHGRWLVPGLHRLPCPIQHGARTVQGRYPLPSRRDPGRGPGPGGVDDLEVRGRQHSLRGGEGWRHRRPEEALRGRTRAPHPALRDRDRAHHRTGDGHSRAGCLHGQPDDGLDHGHVLDVEGLLRSRSRHGQADQHRRQ